MQLQVLLGRRMRIADAAIDETGGGGDLPQLGDLRRAEEIWNFLEHCPSAASAESVRRRRLKHDHLR